MTAPDYVFPKEVGWYVKPNRLIHPPVGLLTLTGGSPFIVNPRTLWPGDADLALTGSAPTVQIASAPVEFDAQADGGKGGGATRDWSHNIGGNTLLVTLQHTENTTPTCTVDPGGANFNVPALTGLTNAPDGAFFGFTSRITVFGVISSSLPQGTKTIRCNSTSTASSAGSVSFKYGGSFSVAASTTSGDVDQSSSAGLKRAAMCAFVGGGNNFGAISPNEVFRYNVESFVTFAIVMGWGVDSDGTGVDFNATHSGAKTGGVVTVLPA